MHGGATDPGNEEGRVCDNLSVCVCVCVRESERERERERCNTIPVGY